MREQPRLVSPSFGRRRHAPISAQSTARPALRSTCIGRYLATRNGDVKKLKPPQTGFRLRCGGYRIFFEQPSERAISITGVRHRREAYR